MNYVNQINDDIAALLGPEKGNFANWTEDEDAALELVHSLTSNAIVICELPREGYLAMQIKGMTLTQSNFQPYEVLKDFGELFEIDVLRTAWSVPNSPHPKACAMARLALQILEARK